MQKQDRWRLVASVAPPLVILSVAAIVACRDAATARKTGEPTVSRVASSTGDIRQALRGRNKHDWVGVAHNRALDDFRKELREPGLYQGGLCGHLRVFLQQTEHLPTEARRLPATVRARMAADAIDRIPICRGTSGFRGASFGATAPNIAVAAIPAQSTAATQLYQDVLAAIDAASGSSDLAYRLMSVMEAASNLDATEQDVILATVSVAQNSYEYWEANGAAVEQEVANEYGDCAQERMDSGYALEDAKQYCLQPSEQRQSSRPLNDRMESRFAAHATLPCGTTMTEGWQRVGKADVDGAWSGGWAGLVAGGQVVQGAIAGAAGSSIYAMLGNAFDKWWCLMAKK